MKINVKKTKVMCISRDSKTKVKICIDEEMMKQVEQFRYLGSLTSEDGYYEKDIQSRTEIAKKAFMNKKRLFTSKMNLELKKRIIRCLISGVWHCTQQRHGVDT